MRLAVGDASGVWAGPTGALRTGAKLKARMPGYTRAAGGAKRAGLQR